MSTPDRPSFIHDATDEEVACYRAVSALAVAGLVTGLLAPLAMFAMLLWVLPLVAVLLSGLALWQIAARQPDLVGRPAAWAGLLLGVTFLVAAPVDHLLYRHYLHQQARQFAETWIAAVRKGEVYRAHQLMLDPRHRRPRDSNLDEYYRRKENVKEWEMLNLFRNERTMKTLFALKEKAQIRFYETTVQGPDSVQFIYAVTFPDEGQQPTTFFIALRMYRSVDIHNGQADWQMVHIEGGIRPAGW